MGLRKGHDHKESTHENSGVDKRRIKEEVKRSQAKYSGRDAAHDRFGGLDIPATLAGMFGALGLATVLVSLLGALGAYGASEGVVDQSAAQEVSVAGAIGGGVLLFLAFLFGGWVAGRMARYDGLRNGLMTAVWFLVALASITAVAAALGSQFNLLDQITVPAGFLSNDLPASALVVPLIALALTLLAGALGGKWGERYHKKADRLVAETTHSDLVTRTRTQEASGAEVYPAEKTSDRVHATRGDSDGSVKRT